MAQGWADSRKVDEKLTCLRRSAQITSNIGLSRPGSNWCWALFGIFALSMLTLGVVAHSRPKRHRAFHYIGLAILAATALHYATQASNLGYTSVPVEFVRSGSRGANQLAGGAPFPPTRSIFYARVRSPSCPTPSPRFFDAFPSCAYSSTLAGPSRGRSSSSLSSSQPASTFRASSSSSSSPSSPCAQRLALPSTRATLTGSPHTASQP